MNITLKRENLVISIPENALRGSPRLDKKTDWSKGGGLKIHSRMRGSDHA